MMICPASTLETCSLGGLTIHRTMWVLEPQSRKSMVGKICKLFDSVFVFILTCLLGGNRIHLSSTKISTVQPPWEENRHSFTDVPLSSGVFYDGSPQDAVHTPLAQLCHMLCHMCHPKCWKVGQDWALSLCLLPCLFIAPCVFILYISLY